MNIKKTDMEKKKILIKECLNLNIPYIIIAKKYNTSFTTISNLNKNKKPRNLAKFSNKKKEIIKMLKNKKTSEEIEKTLHTSNKTITKLRPIAFKNYIPCKKKKAINRILFTYKLDI